MNTSLHHEDPERCKHYIESQLAHMHTQSKTLPTVLLKTVWVIALQEDKLHNIWGNTTRTAALDSSRTKQDDMRKLTKMPCRLAQCLLAWELGYRDTTYSHRLIERGTGNKVQCSHTCNSYSLVPRPLPCLLLQQHSLHITQAHPNDDQSSA